MALDQAHKLLARAIKDLQKEGYSFQDALRYIQENASKEEREELEIPEYVVDNRPQETPPPEQRMPAAQPGQGAGGSSGGGATDPKPIPSWYQTLIDNHQRAGGLIRSAGENIVENYQKLGGEIKDTAQDIGQGISDQFNYNQAQLNREPGAIPEPKESDYRPTITEENGEKKITFSEGLFTRFMKDYSTMMITEYTKQPQTGKDPGPDPLYDMIRGKQGG